MAMSRRFFQNLADDLRARKPDQMRHSAEDYTLAMSVWASMVLGTSNVIQSESPSFNRERFLDAAGFPAELLQRS